MMTTDSKAGHEANIIHFDQMLGFLLGYGTNYAPSKNAIKMPSLQLVQTNANASNTAANSAQASLSIAISSRMTGFLPLSKMGTRILNALKATDTTEAIDEHATSLVHKLQGRRATPKLNDEQREAAKAAGTEVKEVSSSQMGFDLRLDTFDKLLKLLSGIPLYNPNEADLKLTALTALFNDLKAKNAAVLNATIALSNARIARNDVLYKPNTGLVDLAADVKAYIKSVYGATSPQYKQISGLKFSRPRK